MRTHGKKLSGAAKRKRLLDAQKKHNKVIEQTKKIDVMFKSKFSVFIKYIV